MSFVRLMVSLSLLASVLHPKVATAQLSGSRPNIIVVITDDQGYPPIGRHGHPWLKTPNLDEFFDKSTRLTRFLVCPTCSPTRSALMTGRDPLKNGVTHTILERERLTLDATTLPQALKSAGYSTGIFGKWHLGDEEAYQPGKRGFDESFIHGAGGIGQAYDCSCADAPGNQYTNPIVRHNGRFVKTHGFCTDVFFDAALGWIRSQKDADKPFFAYISTNAPHGPYIAPAEYTKRFEAMGFGKDQAGFYGMVENIDANIGRLDARLKEWGLYKNTLVIYMSDNGMTGGGSGQPGKDLAPGFPFFNADHVGLKGSTDEGSVRVPFFVRWDGRITANRDIHTIAAHIDLFPTLAEIARAPLPDKQIDGRSLVPLLENPQVDWPERLLFTHVARWPTGSEPNDYQFVNFAVRSQRFRLIGPRANTNGPPPTFTRSEVLQRSALYDMQSDPLQRTNVLDQFQDVAAQMLQAYDSFWKESRPLMVNEAVPMSASRPYHDAFRSQLAEEGIPDWQPPQL